MASRNKKQSDLGRTGFPRFVLKPANTLHERESDLANPWDILPRPAMGDKDKDQLLIAVGDALSNWEHLEEELAELFTVYVGSAKLHPRENPAYSAFGSINNFYGRTDAIDAAADIFYQSLAEKWQLPLQERHITLLKLSREFAARRNEIAHGRVHWNIFDGALLFPAYYNSRKHRPSVEPSHLYSSKEIWYYRDWFTILKQAAQALVESLMMPPASP
jgi:hypothetical protein